MGSASLCGLRIACGHDIDLAVPRKPDLMQLRGGRLLIDAVPCRRCRVACQQVEQPVAAKG